MVTLLTSLVVIGVELGSRIKRRGRRGSRKGRKGSHQEKRPDRNILTLRSSAKTFASSALKAVVSVPTRNIKAGKNIFTCDCGKSGHERFNTVAVGRHADDLVNGNASVANARLAMADSWVN